MFKKPGRPRGSVASKAATVAAGAASSGKGGGKGRKEKADDDELELVAKDEAKGETSIGNVPLHNLHLTSYWW